MTHIHPLACVDETAEIDATASVGPFSVVEPGVRIGAGTVIGPLCHIRTGTFIGAQCQIHTGSVIGDVPQDRTFSGLPSGCDIGDFTVIREHVTIHRGTAPDSMTRVGKRCMLMAGSHVGHNCQIEDDVTLVNGVLLGGYVHIGARAVLSGNVAVHQFVRIGEGSMIGGLSKITQDVVPYFTVDGPGINTGINRIGLRRAGAERNGIEEVQRAFRVLCRERHSLPVARQMLEAEFVSRNGQVILSFLSFDSRRGFHLNGIEQPGITSSVLSPQLVAGGAVPGIQE